MNRAIREAEQDRAGICLLLRESGGEVYQRHRFTIGVYALSRSSIGGENIFSYEFDSIGYCGPEDDVLISDIHSLARPFISPTKSNPGTPPNFILIDGKLGMDDKLWRIGQGYIEKTRAQHPGDRTTHTLLRLLKRGEELAKGFEKELSERQLMFMRRVAEKLGDNDVKATHLLEEYCQGWCEWAAKRI